MIKRIWHGWTTPDNADRYFNVLSGTVIPGIKAMSLPGFLGIEVLRRDHANEVEFATIMTFKSIDDIVAFQGPDYARSHVPDAARAVLARWEETASHYEVMTLTNPVEP
ncbi:antibiotic biosynthesis monooxygenase [Roseibium sp. MMSF_3412]|uniref:antibiotic biosynthesis monooxygenase family protein n=1 Tax=Roseibium sp. MMSF_3412 TaxID=3046712 RepID=UPI00273EBBD8|nr:antibiotic biosynthesis monooxygenase [Roseibium sp. MMSF_3412]